MPPEVSSEETPHADVAPDASQPSPQALAARKLAEECEAVNFSWQNLCDKVAARAQQGDLVQFAPDDRVVGLTVAEAKAIRAALQAFVG